MVLGSYQDHPLRIFSYVVELQTQFQRIDEPTKLPTKMWLSVVTSWLNGAHPQTSPTQRVGRPVPNLKPHQLEFPADEELDILDALTHLSHTEGAKNADVHEDPGAGLFLLEQITSSLSSIFAPEN